MDLPLVGPRGLCWIQAALAYCGVLLDRPTGGHGGRHHDLPLVGQGAFGWVQAALAYYCEASLTDQREVMEASSHDLPLVGQGSPLLGSAACLGSQ